MQQAPPISPRVENTQRKCKIQSLGAWARPQRVPGKITIKMRGFINETVFRFKFVATYFAYKPRKPSSRRYTPSRATKNAPKANKPSLHICTETTSQSLKG